MARRKDYEKIDINVEPFLSIMAIVLKLISLILVVIVMRIAVNSKARRVIAFAELWQGRGNTETKEPAYFDCHPDKLVIYPGELTVTWEDLQKPNNAAERTLNWVQANKEKKYMIVLVRPKSVKFYRTARKLIANHPGVDVGYDAMDGDFNLKWKEAEKALSVAED